VSLPLKLLVFVAADGWSLVHNQGFKYWSQRRYEKR
jgi:type III secretory pathway component EscR